MFQLDKSLPFAAFVNPKIADTQRLTASEGIGFAYREMQQSFGGDPLVGTTIPNTTISWNSSTETQGLIFEYFQVQGEANPSGPAFPADLEAILKANAGPAEKWNGSYEDWGLVAGVPSKFPMTAAVEVGTARAVIVFLP